MPGGIRGDALREWRRSRKWDVPELAQRLRGAAEGPVASQNGLTRMIYAWERGDHALTERYELLYRKLGFGTGPDSHDTVDPASATDQIAGLLDQFAGQAVEFGRLAETASVGAGTIGQLDAAIDRISRDYATNPPVPLIRRAAEVRSTIFQLLGERQRLSYTRDLYVVAAKCCAFLSWAAGDLGQLASAAAEGRTALILAGEAGHSGAKALACCALSKTAYWDGQTGQAAALAREGFESCPANTTRALLACQESDALPLSHANGAISRARNALDDAAADDDLPGLFSAGAVRLANYTVSYFLKADQPAAALDAARTAMPLPGEQVGYGTWGQLRIGGAIGAARSRQLDETARQLEPVLGLPTGQRLATLTGRLGVLSRTLTSGAYRSDPSAAVIADEIRAYCQDGAGRLALAGREETG